MFSSSLKGNNDDQITMPRICRPLSVTQSSRLHVCAASAITQSPISEFAPQNSTKTADNNVTMSKEQRTVSFTSFGQLIPYHVREREEANNEDEEVTVLNVDEQ